jgi:hypothetical protein
MVILGCDIHAAVAFTVLPLAADPRRVAMKRGISAGFGRVNGLRRGAPEEPCLRHGEGYDTSPLEGSCRAPRSSRWVTTTGTYMTPGLLYNKAALAAEGTAMAPGWRSFASGHL